MDPACPFLFHGAVPRHAGSFSSFGAAGYAVEKGYDCVPKARPESEPDGSLIIVSPQVLTREMRAKVEEARSKAAEPGVAGGQLFFSPASPGTIARASDFYSLRRTEWTLVLRGFRRPVKQQVIGRLPGDGIVVRELTEWLLTTREFDSCRASGSRLLLFRSTGSVWVRPVGNPLSSSERVARQDSPLFYLPGDFDESRFLRSRILSVSIVFQGRRILTNCFVPSVWRGADLWGALEEFAAKMPDQSVMRVIAFDGFRFVRACSLMNYQGSDALVKVEAIPEEQRDLSDSAFLPICYTRLDDKLKLCEVEREPDLVVAADCRTVGDLPSRARIPGARFAVPGRTGGVPHEFRDLRELKTSDSLQNVPLVFVICPAERASEGVRIAADE